MNSNANVVAPLAAEEQARLDRWFKDVGMVYDKPSRKCREQATQGLMLVAIVNALKERCENQTQWCLAVEQEVNLSKFPSSTLYNDTSVVQCYKNHLQKALVQFYTQNPRVDCISDRGSSVSSISGVSRTDLALFGWAPEHAFERMGGVIEIKAFPENNYKDIDNFSPSNRLQGSQVRERALQGVAQTLFYGAVCKEMSDARYFAFIYCNLLVRFQIHPEQHNLILMESLDPSVDSQEPQSVRALLQQIKDGSNPMVHDVTTREGGTILLDWTERMAGSAIDLPPGLPISSGNNIGMAQMQVASHILGDPENIVFAATQTETGRRHWRRYAQPPASPRPNEAGHSEGSGTGAEDRRGPRDKDGSDRGGNSGTGDGGNAGGGEQPRDDEKSGPSGKDEKGSSGAGEISNTGNVANPVTESTSNSTMATTSSTGAVERILFTDLEEPDSKQSQLRTQDRFSSDWLEQVDENGWREREDEEVLDCTVVAKSMDRMGIRVKRVSLEQFASIGAHDPTLAPLQPFDRRVGAVC